MNPVDAFEEYLTGLSLASQLIYRRRVVEYKDYCEKEFMAF